VSTPNECQENRVGCSSARLSSSYFRTRVLNHRCRDSTYL